MSVHITSVHAGSVAPAQLPFILKLCNRPAAETHKYPCPLCTQEMPLIRLQSHLATHMEDISMFVLPSGTADEQNLGSDFSNVAAEQKSVDRGSESDSSTSSLVFSDVAAWPLESTVLAGQSLSNMGQLRHLEEPSNESKIADWTFTPKPDDPEPVYEAGSTPRKSEREVPELPAIKDPSAHEESRIGFKDDKTSNTNKQSPLETQPLQVDSMRTNPSKLVGIVDMGESLYREDHLGSRRTITAPELADIDHLLATIQTELHDHKNTYRGFFDPQKTFIKREAFDRIFTPERILQIVSGLKCFATMGMLKDKQTIAKDIYYGTNSKQVCLKILSILVAMGYPEGIRHLMEGGFSDECLPLRDHRHRDEDRSARLTCNVHSHQHIFNEHHYLASFITWQQCLLTPYIKVSGIPNHYVIQSRHCLPVYAANDSRAIWVDRVNDEVSEIYKVKVHDSHLNLRNYRLRNQQGHVALKQRSSRDRLSFELELSFLLRSMPLNGWRKHLMRRLATFEEKPSSDGLHTFFILFECGQGNLRDLWNSMPGLIRERSHCLWMAEQFHGLAGALQGVHHDLRRIQAGLTEAVCVALGNVTPNDIVWLDSIDTIMPRPELALSRFGFSAFNARNTRSLDVQFPMMATYRAPEVDLPGGRLLSVSDVFSLGCVYLEHISWYLLGYNAVMFDFTELRFEQDIHGFHSDTFFRIHEGPDHRPVPILKPGVKKWIQKLRENTDCTPFVSGMLDVIEHDMLEPESEKRAGTAQVLMTLNRLRLTCLREPSFYLGTEEPKE
jgi:hypothetical protein